MKKRHLKKMLKKPATGWATPPGPVRPISAQTFEDIFKSRSEQPQVILVSRKYADYLVNQFQKLRQGD